jgi:hypothetical protein
MNRYLNVLILLIIFTSATLGQSNTWKLTFQNGDTLTNVTLVSFSGDSLSILYKGSNRFIAVNSINEIRLVKESAIWVTMKQYGLISGIVGGIIAGIAIAISAKGGSFFSITLSNTSAKILGVILGVPLYGAICWVLGAIVGSVVGIIKSADEVYDLSNMTFKGKVVTIQTILSHQRV